MAEREFSAARVRQVPLSMQMFLFFLLTQALKYFVLIDDGPVEGASARNIMLIAACFLPFVLARLPFVVAVLPRVFLRRDARLEVLPDGLIYTFDGVKRPLFVDWPDLEALERGRWGMILHIRNRANLTESMPRFQAEFWRRRIRRPIHLVVVDRLEPSAPLARNLARAVERGGRVSGFGVAAPPGSLGRRQVPPQSSHQGSMAAISSSDQPK